MSYRLPTFPKGDPPRLAAEPNPRPYFIFKNPADGSTFIVHPAVFLPGRYDDLPQISPGAHDPSGQIGIWCNDFETQEGDAAWVDDPKEGFFQRDLLHPEDAIGVRGTVNGVEFRIDDVLQVGRNVVIYQFTRVDTGEYLAYGVGRHHVDVAIAWIEHNKRIANGEIQFVPEEIIPRADRVLSAYPDEESAHFNKGVALMTTDRLEAALECFEAAIDCKPADLYNLLYAAATLVRMGLDSRAVERLLEAQELGTDMTDALATLTEAYTPFRKALDKAIESELANDELRSLRVRYFSNEPKPN